MFVEKCSADGFMSVEFDEHPVKDHLKGPANIFDVTSEGYKNYPSDFLVDGKFDTCLYSRCLIDTAFKLSASQLCLFLDYQTKKLKISYFWVEQFRELLRINCNYPLVNSYQGKLKMLTLLLEERRDRCIRAILRQMEYLPLNAFYEWESDDRFDIIKVKEEINLKATSKAKKLFLLRRRMDFLQEVDNNEEASFIKCIDMELKFLESTVDLQEKVGEEGEKEKALEKIVFKGTGTELAKFIGGIKWGRNDKGDLLFDGSTSSFARLTCQWFCKSNGKEFNEDSIRKFLTKYNEEILNSEE